MGERVASIFAEIGIDAGKFGSGAQSVIGGMGEITDAFGVGNIAALGYAAALAFVVEELRKTVDAAEESAKIQAKLEAVLKATDHAAGLQADELGRLADEIAITAGLDDELVKSSEAVMLTFKNIKGDNFREAMKAAADLSAVMGTDLKSSVMQISKAMNDFDGYTALKRAGVSFTDEQEKQINNFKESNNLMGYQKLILKELQGEFGGAAGSINGASDGSAALNKELGDLYENIGSVLLPEVREFNRELTALLHTINTNFEAVKNLWMGLEMVHRAVLAISTLGLSELLRWWMQRGGEVPPVPTGQATMPHANGGSFLIPQSYGHEGFRLGNGDTASGGEMITITPSWQVGQGNNAPNVTISNLVIGDTAQMTPREIREMIAGAIREVIQ